MSRTASRQVPEHEQNSCNWSQRQQQKMPSPALCPCCLRRPPADWLARGAGPARTKKRRTTPPIHRRVRMRAKKPSRNQPKSRWASFPAGGTAWTRARPGDRRNARQLGPWLFKRARPPAERALDRAWACLWPGPSTSRRRRAARPAAPGLGPQPGGRSDSLPFASCLCSSQFVSRKKLEQKRKRKGEK